MGDPGTSSRPDADCQAGKQAYFERWITSLEHLMDERDRRYEDKFKALDSATDKALSAVQSQTAAAFAANKESVTKTEEGQRAYNAQHNDLTRKMEAQAARFVDRERLEEYEKRFDTKLESLKADIARLQQVGAETGGRHVQQQEHRATVQWSAGQIISTLIAVIGFGLAIAAMLLKSKP